MIPVALLAVAPVEDRVAISYREKGATVRELCSKAGLRFPPKKVFLRAFKQERTLEVWGSNGGSAAFRLIRAYDVAAASGVLGPKRVEGDAQVPEGFYTIDRFNPQSSYWLSMRVSYPNRSDRILGDRARPGGDIYIHGDRKSLGCLAITDDCIKEVYILAWEARQGGQREIPAHIFPFRMTEANIRQAARSYPQHAAFWRQLKPAYDAFEDNRRVPAVRVTSDGAYYLGSR